MASKPKPTEPVIPPAEKGRIIRLTISMGKIFALHQAHQGLDFYERAVGDRVVKEYYALGAMRLDIGRNLSALQNPIDVWEKARQSLVNECKPKGSDTVKPGDPKWPRFEVEFNKMSDEKHEVRLIRIDRARLDLAKNPIPIMVLAALDEILVGEVEDDPGEPATEEA